MTRRPLDFAGAHSTEAIGWACSCGAMDIRGEMLKPHVNCPPGRMLPIVLGGPSWGEMNRGIDRAIGMLDAAIEDA